MTRGSLRRRVEDLEARQTTRQEARASAQPDALAALGRGLLFALPEDLRAEVLAHGAARGVASLIGGLWEVGLDPAKEEAGACALRAFEKAFRRGAA